MRIPAAIFREFVYYPVARLQAGPVKHYLAEYLKTQYRESALLQEEQRARLQTLVEHASEWVPFYAGRLPARITPDRPLLEAVRELPYLTKQDLQRSHSQLTSREPLGRLVTKTTGGSTGEPVTLWKTRDALARELAATWRGYDWAGVEVGASQARFWGVPAQSKARLRAWLTDAVCNRTRYSAFAFDDHDMQRYLASIRRTRPVHFYGYVSMLRAFADYLARTDRSLGYRPLAVITTSEVLAPADRELMARVFGAPVFDEYGCGELGTIAHECKEGSLHLTEENMLIEVLDGDAPAPAGQPGELVVTELNNTAFPLIRYRTGDYGTIEDRECPCGRRLRVLGGIQGRAYDFVRSADGRLFHGEFIMYIFEDIRRQGARIRQFQVEQPALDRFVVRIVRDTDYDAKWEAVIMDRIREHVDAAATFDFQYPERIEREKSGKLRVIKGMGDEQGA